MSRKELLPFIISHLHVLSLGKNDSILRTGCWRGRDGNIGESDDIILELAREKAGNVVV